MMCTLAVHAPRNPDDTLPSRETVQGVQKRALTKDGVRVLVVRHPRGCGCVLDSNDLFQVAVGGSRVLLWIPELARESEFRLMTCADMTEAGHRAVAATMIRFQAHC